MSTKLNTKGSTNTLIWPRRRVPLCTKANLNPSPRLVSEGKEGIYLLIYYYYYYYYYFFFWEYHFLFYLLSPFPFLFLFHSGFWVAPTLIYDVETSSKVVTDEIFGPVLTVLTFRHPKEAVALANNTPFGLAGSVWSQDISLCMDMAFKVFFLFFFLFFFFPSLLFLEISFFFLFSFPPHFLFLFFILGQGWCYLGQHSQPLRCRCRFWRIQREWFRKRRRRRRIV